MPVKQYQLKELRDFKVFVETKYKPKLDELISLYIRRKIPTHAAAFKIAKGVAGNTGAPKAAIKSMEKCFQAPKTMERTLKVAKENQLKTYFIRGKVNTTTRYSKTTNKETKTFVKESKDSYKDAKQIRARSEADARNMFDAEATQDFELDGYSKDVVVNDVLLLLWWR